MTNLRAFSLRVLETLGLMLLFFDTFLFLFDLQLILYAWSLEYEPDFRDCRKLIRETKPADAYAVN